jgi:flagellin-like hook-associated protein FlgL
VVLTVRELSVGHRPLAIVAAAALLLGAAAVPASAQGPTTATSPARAGGNASSALTLLSLALGGHDVRVGAVTLTSDTLTGAPSSTVTVTPLKVDGTAYGEQTVHPGDAPASIPVVDSSSVAPAALGAVASVKSPAFTASATDADGSSARAGTASLGSVRVLGLPVQLDGAVGVTSAVDKTSALGEKTLTIENLALPSVADLLAALGLDLSKLPTATLTALVTELSLVDAPITTARQALDTAEQPIRTELTAATAAVADATATAKTATADVAGKNSALGAAQNDLNAETTALQPLTDALTAAQADLTAANKPVADATAALAAALSAAGLTQAAHDLLPVPVPAVVAAMSALAAAQSSSAASVSTATAAVTSATTALASAQSVADAAKVALDAAQAAVTVANQALTTALAAVDAAKAALATLLVQVQPQATKLVAAVTAALDATPLVSIDRLTVQTQAMVTSAKAGGQSAKVVGGEVQGLRVLGTDVLKNVLGNSTISLFDLTGSTLAAVTGKVNGLTGVLSGVLSNVPTLPTLSVPAPKVELLTKTTSTSITGGFGVAQDSVRALQITIPAITLPAEIALPNAAQLPAFSGLLRSQAVGDLTSRQVVLGLGTLTEQARFRPAALRVTPGTATTPGTGFGTPAQLPNTGLPAGVAVFGVVLVAGAVLLRRRLAEEPGV